MFLGDSYSVEDNLEPTMEWLQERMRLDQKVRVFVWSTLLLLLLLLLQLRRRRRRWRRR